VSGDGAANALVIDNSSVPGARPETWSVTGTNAGTGSGAVNVAFTDVQSLVGSGTDILAGPAANTTWNITGPRSGNVDGMAFSGFYHLQGAADNKDTFVFSPGSAMAGGIDGGGGGYDTMVLNGNFESVVMAATNGNSGSVTLDGNTIDYAGLEPIKLNGTSANVVIDLPSVTDTATLTAGPNGYLTLTASNDSFESTTFADPTGSLTIDMNQDGDTVNVQSLDPGFHGGVTIDSGDNVGPDNVLIAGLDPGVTGAVNIEANVNTSGQALSITAGTINVDSGITIDTQSTTGNSGAISLTGANITLESGSTLNSAA
jgi:hypothetical protein